MKDKIYISGPISDRDPKKMQENIRKFYKAEHVLRSQGYHNILNPARLAPGRWPWLYRMIGYRITLLYDLWHLTRCQRICQLPDWEKSRGARLEYSFAVEWNVKAVPSNIRKLVEREVSKQQ